MSRRSFLTVASVIALAVSIFAVAFPATLLRSKGVEPTPCVVVWVREVGALICAAGTTKVLD